MQIENTDQIDVTTPFRVSDIKQWAYCPRILFFAICLPNVRPVTYKMTYGIESGKAEEDREVRRSLRLYGLTEGHREFEVPVESSRLGLRGRIDMVIWGAIEGREEIIPVDYKNSTQMGEHFRLQLAAYGVILEEMTALPAKRAFLYSIITRSAEEVKLDNRLREKLFRTLEEMHRMLWSEAFPGPTENLSRCVACEFRRFCNDVY